MHSQWAIMFSVMCRQHPGQYEYYKNYDDLEVEHHLANDIEVSH